MRDIYIRTSGLLSAAWIPGTQTTITGIMQAGADTCAWTAGIKLMGSIIVLILQV